MKQKLTDKYTYERQLGSIVLTDTETKNTVFFQCGDDANEFDEKIETLDKAYKVGKVSKDRYEEVLNHLCSQYF